MHNPLFVLEFIHQETNLDRLTRNRISQKLALPIRDSLYLDMTALEQILGSLTTRFLDWFNPRPNERKAAFHLILVKEVEICQQRLSYGSHVRGDKQHQSRLGQLRQSCRCLSQGFIPKEQRSAVIDRLRQCLTNDNNLNDRELAPIRLVLHMLGEAETTS